MKSFRTAAAFVVVMMMPGCAGSLYTYADKNEACVKPEDVGSGICEVYKGILYRPLTPYRIAYKTDRILDAEGKVTHFEKGPSGAACAPVDIVEIELRPDADKEYVLNYVPARFESSTFSVELTAQGSLSKVGASSTSGASAAVDSAVGLLGLFIMPSAEGAAPSIPRCSHGKVVQRVDKCTGPSKTCLVKP